ncbi:MAG: thiamine pyrophosphate-dependent dehydrogenase E1 component subunit alpha [Acidobacteria bacterium]|nr:thiamine pyrophosphate-dependent dehydrogenase E1 component subunit alpha [Acidobacteriota bacterium]
MPQPRARKAHDPASRRSSQTRTTPSLIRDQQLEIYYYLRLTRSIEEKLANLYRQGKIVGGLYRSLGQEGQSVGSAYALQKGDFLAPMIRNLGSLIVKGVRPWEIFTQYMARATSPTGGKDGVVHLSDIERGIIGPISHLGDLIPVMTGIALASKMKKLGIVALTYIGDGGASTGIFHEALNMAAVLKAPFILIVEDNGFAYSTPKCKQVLIENFADRAAGYGIPGETVDGNDLLAVYEATGRAAERARRGDGPTLLEVKTFRMKGHAEHDDARYVPQELLEYWRARDPVDRYIKTLTESGLASEADLREIDERVEAELQHDLEFAEQSPFPNPESAFENVYSHPTGPRWDGRVMPGLPEVPRGEV